MVGMADAVGTLDKVLANPRAGWHSAAALKVQWFQRRSLAVAR